ncbi:MAG: hypothetical protein ACXWCM_13195, partial [Acidimicrobiales bacterium]
MDAVVVAPEQRVEGVAVTGLGRLDEVVVALAADGARSSARDRELGDLGPHARRTVTEIGDPEHHGLAGG